MSNRPDQFTFKELIASLSSFAQYLLGQWRAFLTIMLLSGALLIAFNYIGDKTYKAQTSFVLQNSDSGLNEISSLASIAGVNLGGITDGSDLFQIDNVQELYRSNRMIVQTLLSKAEFPEGEQLLVERYIANKGYDKRWAGSALEGVNFSIANFGESRLQDSLLLEFSEDIRKDMLVVSKPNRKLSILNILVADEDPYLAKAFNEELVKNVNSFYKKTRTQKSGENLTILQRQSDSVKMVLDGAIQKLAELQEASPNRNPLYKTVLVDEQKLMIDIAASTAIYETVVTNLELAKISHRNNTPLIQIIDYPVLPLPDDRWKFSKALIIGLLIGAVLALLWLSLRRFYQLAMAS